MNQTGISPLGLESVDDVELSIDEAVERIEEIVDVFDQGDVSLGTGKELYDEAVVLLEYVEDEASIDGGEVEQVSP